MTTWSKSCEKQFQIEYFRKGMESYFLSVESKNIILSPLDYQLTTVSCSLRLYVIVYQLHANFTVCSCHWNATLNLLSLHLKFKKLTISLSCNWHVKNLKMHEPQELVKTKNSAFRDEQLSLCPTEKAVASLWAQSLFHGHFYPIQCCRWYFKHLEFQWNYHNKGCQTFANFLS